MASGEVDTTALIIVVCVIVPALIAIGVCAVIYFAHRNKDRKMHRPADPSASYGYPRVRDRPAHNAYTIDFTHVNRPQQHQQPLQSQRRARGPPPVFEQSPPSYDTSINRTPRQQLPRFSPVRTTPSLSSTYIHRASPVVSPSICSAMPPSYAEIFLAPHALPNDG